MLAGKHYLFDLRNNYYLIVVIPIVLVIAIGAYYSVRIAVADVYAYKAKYLLGIWEKGSRLPTAEEADYAVEKASDALEWEPNNTEYMDLKAHVLTYKGLLYWGDGRFSDITDESVELYVKATAIRPKWPYAWARLALVKAYRGEFDALFVMAMENSVNYGPWEPGVQKTVTEAGLYGWNNLTKTTRVELISNIQRGLSFNFKAIEKTLNRYKKKNLVCTYLQGNDKRKKLCGW